MHSKPAARQPMSNWFSAAALAASFALALPAHAQSQTALAGQWAFRSENAAIGCTITGQATLRPARGSGRYNVRMIATETCDGRVNSQVDETCVATRMRTHLSVRCTVDRGPPGYLPDDFELDIVGDGRMQGLLTANWNAPAEWRKLGAANIS